MTQDELREFIFKLTQTLVKKNCYIKGYGGKQWRVMDEAHNPEINIDNRQMEVLKYNKIVFQDGLVYRLLVTSSPFTHKINVALPQPK